jgi:ABC-type microcin C transport system permease subunit YejB
MHNKDVWQLIKEKLPVSISAGAVELSDQLR